MTAPNGIKEDQGCGCIKCPSCSKYNRKGSMRCDCGHFFYQMCGSTSPTVPDNARLVLMEEGGAGYRQVGWFSTASGWWNVLSDERSDGEKMPSGTWCSLSTGNITGWREIYQPKDHE